MDPKQKLLYDKAVELDDRITYFLLAVAAAGIGYAVQRSDDLMYQGRWEVVLAAAAVLLWGASFASGCMKLLAMKALIQSNLRLLQLSAQKMAAEAAGRSVPPDFVKILQDRETALTNKGNAQRRWFGAQLWALAGGAISFVWWQAIVIVDQTAPLFRQ